MATRSLWRYSDVLPDSDPVSLGEGLTPLLRSRRWPGMFLKNEAQNPTGSFSDRGSSVAISAAKQLGIKNIIAKLPSAGAVSLAAYASAAGIQCHLYIPKGVESVARQ